MKDRQFIANIAKIKNNKKLKLIIPKKNEHYPNVTYERAIFTYRYPTVI